MKVKIEFEYLYSKVLLRDCFKLLLKREDSFSEVEKNLLKKVERFLKANLKEVIKNERNEFKRYEAK